MCLHSLSLSPARAHARTHARAHARAHAHTQAKDLANLGLLAVEAADEALRSALRYAPMSTPICVTKKAYPYRKKRLIHEYMAKEAYYMAKEAYYPLAYLGDVPRLNQPQHFVMPAPHILPHIEGGMRGLFLGLAVFEREEALPGRNRCSMRA